LYEINEKIFKILIIGRFWPFIGVQDADSYWKSCRAMPKGAHGSPADSQVCTEINSGVKKAIKIITRPV
jgi:hypothetical protein